MFDSDPLISDTAHRILTASDSGDRPSPRTPLRMDASTWQLLVESGLAGVGVAEAVGGEGGSLADALAIAHAVGSEAAPVPFVETAVLAGWLLSETGQPWSTGPLTTALPPTAGGLWFADGAVSGELSAVPWAVEASMIVALAPSGEGDVVVCLPTEALTVEPCTNLAGEGRDRVVADRVHPTSCAAAPLSVTREALMLRGGLTRATLMSAALDKICELTVEYSRAREQFGRPIGKFQAVQQHLVHLAEQAAMVKMAVQVAARELDRGGGQFETAVAKWVANQAAAAAPRSAHQVHGAIGMTQEYPLHAYTTRLWSWRNEYGADMEWSYRLGRAAAAAGADSLYPLITAGATA